MDSVYLIEFETGSDSIYVDSVVTVQVNATSREEAEERARNLLRLAYTKGVIEYS